MSAEDQPAVRDASTSGATRLNRWLGATALVLLGAVLALGYMLLQREVGERPGASPPQAADATPGAAAPSVTTRDGVSTPPRPYRNLLAPGAAPPQATAAAPPPLPAAASAGAAAPPPGDPLGALLQGLGGLLDDPGLGAALDDLGTHLQQSASLLGRLFDDLPDDAKPSRGGKGAQAPNGARGRGSAAASGSDPLGRLLTQALALFGGAVGSLGGGGGTSASGRIAARVEDAGRAYVVTCEFPEGAPETASFQVRGETLVVQARFPVVGEEQQEVQLPGPVHPMGARSALRDGRLVVTVPKV